MVNIVVITHGEFGAYLVEAAEEIVGRQGDGIRVVSISPRLSLEEVRRNVVQAVEELRVDDGLIVVTDMPGGTPTNVVLPLVKDLPGVRVVSGLNLYMLVSAFSHRTRGLPADAVVRRMLEDAAKSIRDIKAVLTAVK